MKFDSAGLRRLTISVALAALAIPAGATDLTMWVRESAADPAN